MTALFVTVLFASLAGSLHCAGMCGAFVAFAIGVGDPSVKASRGLLLALYQVGRLVTYTLLGALAGLIGAGVDLGGQLVGVGRAAAILSGIMMVGFGTITLLSAKGVKLDGPRVPAFWTKLVAGAHRHMMRFSPMVRAGATGLLTTLLPCGWLYAFVLTAAGTGHAWSGAALMATFWVGTLPMLTIVGVGVRKLSGAFAGKLPVVTAMAIVVVGLYTIAARAGVHLPAARHVGHQTATELQQQLKSIDEKSLPCCTQKAAQTPAAEGAMP